MSRIYAASSWRNEHFDGVVALLRGLGHIVFDFKNPKPGVRGFHWSEIDPDWESWTPERFREALASARMQEAFKLDSEACEGADATVLILPCNRSAHLELGVAKGRGQRVCVYFPPGVPVQPELMYGWCEIAGSETELTAWITRAEESLREEKYLKGYGPKPGGVP